MKEVPPGPSSRTFKKLDCVYEVAFKFGFIGGFENTIVGTGVPDGPLSNGQKYLSDLCYFGPSRTPVPTAPFFRIYSSGTINCNSRRGVLCVKSKIVNNCARGL